MTNIYFKNDTHAIVTGLVSGYMLRAKDEGVEPHLERVITKTDEDDARMPEVEVVTKQGERFNIKIEPHE